MHKEQPQTGLILPPATRTKKSALKSWTTDDLVGFARPEGMPFETYRQLRRLKNMEFERRNAPVKIWKSSNTIDEVQAFLKDGTPLPPVQGTYRKAIHGLIGRAHQNN